MDLRIIPTTEGRGFLIHVEDHDCSELPLELKYIDPITAKGLCQFIIDNSQHNIYVKNHEIPTWTELFGKINYDISFNHGRLLFKGLNGFNLNL